MSPYLRAEMSKYKGRDTQNFPGTFRFMTLRAARHLETSGSDFLLVIFTPQKKGMFRHAPIIASKFEILFFKA
jgi:hypothetical protein